MAFLYSILPEKYRPENIPDQKTLAGFRTPAVNFITQYTQINRDNLPIHESALLSKASKETLDNSSTGFVVGGAIPFALSKFVKFRAGVGIIRMCAGVVGATFGSYVAAKNTTDKYIITIMTTDNEGAMSKGLRNMLFEYAPRSELYKFVQQKLKANGFSEEAWESKDTFATKDEETQKWIEENEKNSSKNSNNNNNNIVVDKLSSSSEIAIQNSPNKNAALNVRHEKVQEYKMKTDVKRNGSISSDTSIELPETKDNEVAAKRKAYQHFLKEEKLKAGYGYNDNKMSKEDEAKVENAVISKLAAWNKERKKRKEDSLTYNFNSSKNDISNGSTSNNNLENQVEDRSDFNEEEASNNNTSFDFFNTYLFQNDDNNNSDDSTVENDHRGENREDTQQSNKGNMDTLSPFDKWKRIDSYMDYGDTGNSNSKQSTFNTQNNNKKKTTWEEIRHKHRFA